MLTKEVPSWVVLQPRKRQFSRLGTSAVGAPPIASVMIISLAPSEKTPPFALYFTLGSLAFLSATTENSVTVISEYDTPRKK